MILPFLILVFMFSYYPLYGWIYALYDYHPPLKLSQSEFAGLKWFIMLFGNPTQAKQLGQVMLNTFAISGLGILTSVFPLGFAVFLMEIPFKGFRKVVQTLTTLPNFISWVLVYSIAFALFSSSGAANHVLMDLNLIDAPIKFMDSDSHTWLKMCLWNVWKGLGWGAIMYLAAISGIDQTLYEAAKVDGAGRFQLIRHITLPGLLPTYFVLLMLSIANFLTNGIDQYYVFRNPFNLKYIQVLDLYVYLTGLGSSSISLATAVGVMKSIVSVTLLFIVNRISKMTRGESIV